MALYLFCQIISYVVKTNLWYRHLAKTLRAKLEISKFVHFAEIFQKTIIATLKLSFFKFLAAVLVVSYLLIQQRKTRWITGQLGVFGPTNTRKMSFLTTFIAHLVPSRTVTAIVGTVAAVTHVSHRGRGFESTSAPLEGLTGATNETITPLLAVKRFPLCEEAVAALDSLKTCLSTVTLGTIDERLPFTVESDASEHAISATLNQQNRPVAFFSRTLNNSELRYSSVEKEATAIVEAIRKWAHFLTGCRFTVVTDQQSVSFMYDCANHGKVKNTRENTSLVCGTERLWF